MRKSGYCDRNQYIIQYLADAFRTLGQGFNRSFFPFARLEGAHLKFFGVRIMIPPASLEKAAHWGEGGSEALSLLGS
jgi:hypothetical protein